MAYLPTEIAYLPAGSLHCYHSASACIRNLKTSKAPPES